MKGVTLDSNLKLVIHPEGQEIIREITALTSNKQEITDTDLAVIVGDALMYYKILLENKAKGGETLLKRDNEEVKLPVISSFN